MKNLMLAAATLLVIAGTASTATVFTASATAAIRNLPGTKSSATAMIPPPMCPPTDPNGCGIYSDGR